MNSAGHRRGIVLVVVLWVALLLATLAGGFVLATRTEVQITRNLVTGAQSRELAGAGVNLAVLKLLEDPENGAWRRDGTVNPVSLKTGEIRIAIQDEGGKIDVNAASDELLKGLFRAAGVGPDQADALLDSVRDWQDADPLRRLNGAEDGDYRAAGLPYGAKDAPFEVVDELQQVLGLAPATFRRISGAVTVYSRQRGINLMTAPREALLALPGATIESVDAFLAARRDETDPRPIAGLLGPDSLRFHSRSANAYFAIRALATTPDGTAFVRDAVVQLLKGSEPPYAVHLWRQGDRAAFDRAPEPGGGGQAITAD